MIRHLGKVRGELAGSKSMLSGVGKDESLTSGS